MKALQLSWRSRVCRKQETNVLNKFLLRTAHIKLYKDVKHEINCCYLHFLHHRRLLVYSLFISWISLVVFYRLVRLQAIISSSSSEPTEEATYWVISDLLAKFLSTWVSSCKWVKSICFFRPCANLLTRVFRIGSAYNRAHGTERFEEGFRRASTSTTWVKFNVFFLM